MFNFSCNQCGASDYFIVSFSRNQSKFVLKCCGCQCFERILIGSSTGKLQSRTVDSGKMSEELESSMWIRIDNGKLSKQSEECIEEFLRCEKGEGQ